MPWNAKSFATKHNHKLTGNAASTAARQATAMVRAGVPEGEAIATANKTGNRIAGYARGGLIEDTDNQSRRMKRNIEQYRNEADQPGPASVPLTRDNDKTPDLEFGRERDNVMTSNYAKGGNVKPACYAAGGVVLGRTRDFMKEPDVFREDRGPGAKQDYAGGKPNGKDKSLPNP